MISEALFRSQKARISFVMVDALYQEVSGLGGTPVIHISKNGGPWVLSTGLKGEIGFGWYYYDFSAIETDTVGPLAIYVTGAGCIQQNLEYVVEQRNAGACPFTYTLINSITLLPIPGAEVWFCTDPACTNVVWYGTTDAFGVVHDSMGLLPFLDPGTYYLKRHKAGFTFAITDIEVVSCSTILVAKDSGSNGFNGVYSNVTLGGNANRAYFNGVNSQVDIYTPGFAAAFVGAEVTAIIRSRVADATVYSDANNHNMLSIYSFPFGNDLTIDISAGGLLEWTMMNSGFPGIILVQVAGGDLAPMTCGMTISGLASQLIGYKNGVQQGISGGGIAWNNPLYLHGCFIGYPKWKGWLYDCIVSFGVVATAPQMLTIHNALTAGTLTTAMLDTIFGANKYTWWMLDEGP
jgi:hypothetical protein